MPLYPYECRTCEHRWEEYQRMGDFPIEACPECHGATVERVPSLPHTPQKEYRKPIEMHSIAYSHPDDIREFKKRHPDVQCSLDPRDPNYGVPIARSRHEKMAILKAEGWAERK